MFIWVLASSTTVREKATSSSQKPDLHHCQGFDYCLKAKCPFTTLREYCSCHAACVLIYWIHYHKETCQTVSGKRSREAVTPIHFLWYSAPWFLWHQSRKFTLNTKQRRELGKPARFCFLGWLQTELLLISHRQIPVITKLQNCRMAQIGRDL